MTEISLSQVFRADLLKGQVCLVTGAGTGLGRATSLELCRLGAHVIGCGRRSGPLEATAGLASGMPGCFTFEALDIRDEEGVESFVGGVIARHGRIDLLVNNAGGQFLSPAEAITPKGFRTVIDLNVQGTWLMTHAVATKAMIPQEDGKVISITLSPHNGMPGMVHSGAARAAVENMMKTLSIEWSRFNIRTCAIAAGQFGTETLRTKYPKVVVDNVERSIPAGRVGEPDEMAWLVAYLASPAGNFFSGAVLTIDGARDNWFGPYPPGSLISESGQPPAEERKPRE